MGTTTIPYFEEVYASISGNEISLRHAPYDNGEGDPIPFIWETEGLGCRPTNKFRHSSNGPSKTEFRLRGNKIELPTDRSSDRYFFIPYYREVEARILEMPAEGFGRCLYCGCKLNPGTLLCGQCGAPA